MQVSPSQSSTPSAPVAQEVPSSSLLDVPDDVLILLLGHISCPRKLEACLRSCRSLHRLAHRQDLHAQWLALQRPRDDALFMAASTHNPRAEELLLTLLHVHQLQPTCPSGAARVAGLCASRGFDTALQCMLGGGLVRPDCQVTSAAYLGLPTDAGEAELTLLHVASLAGTVGVIETLLAAGADVHARAGSEGATALHMASGEGHVSCCAALMRVPGIELGCASSLETALHAAARWNHTGVVQLLLEADPGLANVVDAQDCTALQLASSLGHAATVDLICSLSGAELTVLNHRDRSIGETALMRACGQGHEDVVEVLLAQPGIDVNQRSSAKQETALHFACRGGHARVCSQLLCNGRAEVDTPNHAGCSALWLSSSLGRPTCTDVLLLAGAQPQPEMLLAACMCGHKSVAEQLVYADSSLLGTVDSTGATCLMAAAGAGAAGLVASLLDFGADFGGVYDPGVEAPTDICGNTVLHHAAACTYGEGAWGADTMAVLLDKLGQVGRALLFTENDSGDTPLATAARFGLAQTVEVVVNAAPDTLDVRSSRTGMTPLAVASRQGHDKVAQVLLCAGASFQ